MGRAPRIAATLAVAAAACSLAGVVGAGQGAAGAVPPGEHPRLQQRIDLDEPCIGLEEALRTVGRRTGVTLRVSPELAPENVLLIIRARPAGEVLERLAELLEYRWRKRGDGDREEYELYQPAEVRRREQDLRVRFQQLALSEIERELAELDGYFALPEAEVQRQMQAAWKERQRPAAEGDTAAQDHTRRMGQAMLDNARHMATLFRRLTAAQRARLARGEALRFSAVAGREMERLPKEVVDALVMQKQQRGAVSADWYATHPPQDVRAELRFRWQDGRVYLIGRSQVFAPRPEGYDPPGEPLRPDAGIFIWRRLDPGRLDPALTRLPKQSADERLHRQVALSLERPVVASDPSSYVAHSTMPAFLAGVAKAEPGLSFIADSTLKAIRPPTSARGTVQEFLNRAARENGYRWRFDPRGYVLARNSTAFADRPRAIPAAQLRGLMERSLRNDGFTLADHVGLAAELTDAQVDGFSESGDPIFPMQFRWPPILTQMLQMARDDLRLLATLTPDQLRLLEVGEPLPVSRLTPRQRAACFRAVENRAAWADQDGQPIGTVARPLPPINLLLVRTASPGPPAPGKHRWTEYDLSYTAAGEKRPLVKRRLWTDRGDTALKPKDPVTMP